MRRRSRARPVPVQALLVLWGALGVVGMVFVILGVEILTRGLLIESTIRLNERVFSQLGWNTMAADAALVSVFQFAAGGFVAGAGVGYHFLRGRERKGQPELL